MTHWCVQAAHLLPTQRNSFLGSEGEQADDLSTGSTPTGNVDGGLAFLVSCGEGLVIQANRLHAHNDKSRCVCLSFRCEPMMWQSSMLISLLVLSPEQVYVTIWVVIHDSIHSGPITLREPLVVLIGRHKDMLVKISQIRTGIEGEGVAGQGRRIGLVYMVCWGGVWNNITCFGSLAQVEGISRNHILSWFLLTSRGQQTYSAVVLLFVACLPRRLRRAFELQTCWEVVYIQTHPTPLQTGAIGPSSVAPATKCSGLGKRLPRCWSMR